ncbi:MAG: FtsX-like permease family protein, partial [Oscillospiraceae bacterium]|nr:FtsX-like permease family protein [Oscillospiraceae bacterium]
MNILNTYTRKSLLRNRTRTLVTVIGILLSMALFTAVIEGAYSGQQYLIRSVIAADGDWHVAFSGTTQVDLERIEADPLYLSHEYVVDEDADNLVLQVKTKTTKMNEVQDFAVRIGADYSLHRDLLMMYGGFGSSYFTSALYGFAAVLVGLVFFGSVSLIYNSFSISVSERTRQFGILKSIGATKKQIRRSVLYEALVLAGVGIPLGLIVGCVGIGLTLYFLRDAFSAFVMDGSEVKIRLVLNPLILLCAVLVCLLTTLISAWVPARRAMRVMPIDAIRQSGDVKIRAKEVRTSRVTEKLFGFEGTMASKNFKRNRKRYRSTVVSLFLSVVLFISAASFCAYLTDTVDSATDYDTGEDIAYYTVGDDRPDPEELLRALSVEGVTQALYYEEKSAMATVAFADADPSLLALGDTMLGDSSTDDAFTWWALACFLRDEDFRALCAENRIDPEPYFDPDNPMALIKDENTTRLYDEEGNAR